MSQCSTDLPHQMWRNIAGAWVEGSPCWWAFLVLEGIIGEENCTHSHSVMKTKWAKMAVWLQFIPLKQ